MTDRKGGWMQTFTGHRFWPLDARPEEVYIADIAHGLANTCRFGGHSQQFYSVAQHSVLVSRIVPVAIQFDALLHDAAEAYLGDVPRPLKHGPGFEGYRSAEAALEQVIADTYGTEYPQHPAIKEADNVLLWTEKRDIMPRLEYVADGEWAHGAEGGPELALPGKIIPWDPALAEVWFLKRFDELLAERAYRR